MCESGRGIHLKARYRFVLGNFIIFREYFCLPRDSFVAAKVLIYIILVKVVRSTEIL